MNNPKRILPLMVGLAIFLGLWDTTQAQGLVIGGSVDSKILKRQIAYNVYTPEGHNASMNLLPVLYLLHGHGGSEKDWFSEKSGNIAHLLDSLISSDKIPPMVAVSLDAGNSWYVDSKESMESFYLKEFIPFIENEFPVDTKAGRTIAGNSAGGYGALRFSLLDPRLFERVILLSPAAYEPLPPMISSSRNVEAFAENGRFSERIWKSFSYTSRWTNLLESPKRPCYFLSTGDDDAYHIVPIVSSLQQEMIQDKVCCELRVIDGGHTWDVWRNQIVEALVLMFNDESNSH